MTSILKILTQYCDVYVDDINFKELLHTNAPLYARRMWQLFRPSISLFTIPAETQNYLLGTPSNPRITEPLFNDYRFTATQTYTADYTLELGTEYVGFELFSANIIVTDSLGGATITATNAQYNSSTGTIIIPASETEPLTQGTVIEFDFFTDGYFEADLSAEMLNILGVCFQCVWTDRFNTDWLSNVSKIEDKSFSEQNRANKMRADTERLEAIQRKLAGLMRRFEQNGFYKQNVSPKYKF